MTNQELLDSIVIGEAPITGKIYIGLLDKDGSFKVKSDFTERLQDFIPKLFIDEVAND